MKTVIIGGGIAGLTTAIALQRIGLESIIYEAAPTIKSVGAGLTLAANAIKGFTKIGIAEDVIKAGRLLPSYTIYDEQKRYISRTNSPALSRKYGIDNVTIHRADLHRVLLSHVDAAHIVTNRKAIRVEHHAKEVLVHFDDSSSVQADCLIVADGIHSHIRQQLLPKITPRYAGYTCWRAIADNSRLKISEVSETWGLGRRFGIVPLANDQLYWFACLNAPRLDETMHRFGIDELMTYFQHFHQPIPNILRETRNEQLLHNDILDLPSLPHYAFDNILLVGDAAYATTPNMGQGACQAIEDAIVIADELQKDSNIRLAFQRFEQRRFRRTQSIIKRSYVAGWVGQLENKWLAPLRNGLFRLVPESITERQMATLYDVDF